MTFLVDVNFNSTFNGKCKLLDKNLGQNEFQINYNNKTKNTMKDEIYRKNFRDFEKETCLI